MILQLTLQLIFFFTRNGSVNWPVVRFFPWFSSHTAVWKSVAILRHRASFFAFQNRRQHHTRGSYYHHHQSSETDAFLASGSATISLSICSAVAESWQPREVTKDLSHIGFSMDAVLILRLPWASSSYFIPSWPALRLGYNGDHALFSLGFRPHNDTPRLFVGISRS